MNEQPSATPTQPAPNDKGKGQSLEDRKSSLLLMLAENPRICPNCGNRDIRTTESQQLLSVSGDKKCLACGCWWAPRLPLWAGVIAVLVGGAGVFGVLFGFNLLQGGDSGNDWRVLKGIIGCFFALCIGICGLGVLAGKYGKAKIHYPGNAQNAPSDSSTV